MEKSPGGPKRKTYAAPGMKDYRSRLPPQESPDDAIKNLVGKRGVSKKRTASRVRGRRNLKRKKATFPKESGSTSMFDTRLLVTPFHRGGKGVTRCRSAGEKETVEEGVPGQGRLGSSTGLRRGGSRSG